MVDEKSKINEKILSNERIRKYNEECFLSNNEKIHYDSIIILEMFYIEECKALFEGLDLLYSNLNGFDKSRLDYWEIFHNTEKDPFIGSKYLPILVHENLKNNYLPNVASLNLGNSIESINITLQTTLPSIITVQIQASLDSSISDEINEIIYSYHDEMEVKNKAYECEFINIISPNHIKNKEINEIKNRLKKEVIGFLSEYFEGIFFKLSNKHISYVPSIDLISLDYPEKSEDIKEWLSENHAFFDCFNISLPWMQGYKHEYYLFVENSSQDKEIFMNYSIIANRKLANKSKGYSSIKSSIQYPLNHYSFETICFNRWLQIENRTGAVLSSLMSKELEYIRKNNFEKIISNREVVTKYLFYFERFKIEFNNFTSLISKHDLQFESLYTKDAYLIDQIIKRINNRINYISEFISTLNRHSDNTLALKNIEYNKKMQNSVLFLTLVIIVISVVQICLTLTE